MQELKEIVMDIQEMLECAEDYAKEAVKHKMQYPDLASTYARIAQDDLAHADMLHKHAVEMIQEHQKQQPEPSAMKAIWDWEHERQITKTEDVKRLLDMYRM